MDPIAVVTWTDAQGCENIHRCYESNTLNAFMSNLQEKNYVFVVCMTSVHTRIPTRPRRRHIRAV